VRSAKTQKRSRPSAILDISQGAHEIAGKRITPICCHSFRATGITNYLLNGGTLEKAQKMANHESAKSTKLYDRRDDDLTLDEVERITI